MSKVVIAYPGLDEDYWERLDYELHSPDTVRLRQHASFIPLGPGDVVTVKDGMVTGVVSLAPVYTVEVNFYLPADVPAFHTPTPEHKAVKAVQRTFEEWRQHAAVTQETGFSGYVSSESWAWLESNVCSHRFVKYAEMIRTPDTDVVFDVAIQNPDIAGTREGPFA